MAAGLGFKTFTTGEVLTAADTNGYLMQGINVFASTAARDAAITSPQEGQFAFTKDTNGLWYYDGAAWVASGATGDIEGVTAGIGISGGGTSGTVTVTNSMATAIDAKGDLIAGTAADTFDRLAVGTNGQTLVADSTASTGLKWATPSASTPTFVGCMLRKTDSTQAISTSTYTIVTFDNEIIDTDGFHSDVTNNGRITIPAGKGGKYLITAALHYAANATNSRRLLITKNGDASTGTAQADQRTGGFSGAASEAVFSGIISLDAADYIVINAFQDSGSTVNLLGYPSAFCYFSATYLGA